MKVQGLVTITSAVDHNGDKISVQRLVDRGALPNVKAPAGWGVDREEVCIGFNAPMLNMRQYIAYLMGYRAPVSNYAIGNFGIGTGTQAPASTDVALQSPINFYNGTSIKPVASIDFPGPFLLRVNYSIGLGEANGFAITEMGLFSGDGTLMARKTCNAINKDSTWSPSLLWRLRF